MKTCSKCKVSKAEDSFAKRRLSKDGLTSWCKQCQAQYEKLYRAEKPASNILEYGKLRNEEELYANVGKLYGNWLLLSYLGSCAAKGGGRRAQYLVECQCSDKTRKMLAFRELKFGKSTKCVHCNLRNLRELVATTKHTGVRNPCWRGTKDIPQSYFADIQRGADARGLEFSIDIIFLQNLWDAQEHICPYTGLELKFRTYRKTNPSGKYDNWNYASLDRIDSNKGYVAGNVEWVSKVYNRIKMDMLTDEFLKLITLIYNHRLAPSCEDI